MTLRLYNTLTRSKEEFVPIDPAAVRLYVCGPTVYDFAHVGNARPVIVFDVLFRLLRHFYGADHLIYARNVTDVDDKINARADCDFPDLPFNEAIARVTQATERQFHEDVAALGALPPTSEPRATEHIEKMRALIDRLVARGVAYVVEDHVLFSPSAMDALPGAPRYGSLARRSLDEMLAGARIEVAPYKRDPMDFVLWKPSKPKEPSWPSPAGIAALGRPGWHIECSAMSMAKLLEPFGGGLSCDDPSRNTFDIHGGGIDLVFPHHENEIAQSCCAFGSTRMANFWMHNGFLQVEGEKMAKSLGNFVTIRGLLRGWKGEPWSGVVVRFAMLETHYRQPIDWTLERLTQAKANIQAIAGATTANNLGGEESYAEAWAGEPRPSLELIGALSDDLNTSEAIGQIRRSISRLPQLSARERVQLVHDMRFLGLFTEEDQRKWLVRPRPLSELALDLVDLGSLKYREYMIGQANGDVQFAKSAKDWLSENLIKIDGPNIIFEGTQERRVDDLVREREAARKRKDWATSDRLRDELASRGFIVKDNKDGTTTLERI